MGEGQHDPGLPVGGLHAPEAASRGVPAGRRPSLPTQGDRHLRPAPALLRFGRRAALMGLYLGGTVGSALVGLGYLAPIGVSVAFFVVYIRALRAKVGRFNAALGVAADEELIGSPAEARRQYEGLASGMRYLPAYQAAALHALARFEITEGHHARALQHLATARQVRQLRFVAPLPAEEIPFLLSFTYALLGDAPAAREWLTEGRAKRTLPQVQTDRLAEAALALLEKRYDDAVQAVHPHLRVLENRIPGRFLRAARILCAMAMAHRGDPDDDVEAMLGGARPFVPGEYDYLGREWPALQAFLGERHLT